MHKQKTIKILFTEHIDTKVAYIENLQQNLFQLNTRLAEGQGCEVITLEDIQEYDKVLDSDNEDSDEEENEYAEMDVNFSGQYTFKTTVSDIY